MGLSLAEAETVRRILHVRNKFSAQSLIPRASTEVCLRYSPATKPKDSGARAGVRGHGGEGYAGLVFDSSLGWGGPSGSGATASECAEAQSCFRFFDCDMHFAPPDVHVLVRSLRAR